MCVALTHGPHGLVIVSNNVAKQLCIYSLADGSLIRRIGSKGSGKGQFNFYLGGLCVSPDGDSLLVAEYHNNRVQQVRIVDGSWVRFVGEGVLDRPQFVDCNADVVVVSESWNHRISVFSWADGSVRAQFGSNGSGPGQLKFPFGVRLLADGSGVVVADHHTHRLCVFRPSGEFLAAVGSREQGLSGPLDVLECAPDGSFIVSNFDSHNLIKFSKDGSEFEVFGKRGDSKYKFYGPTALATLPGGGLVVQEWYAGRFQVFRGFELRKTWITVCVKLSICG